MNGCTTEAPQSRHHQATLSVIHKVLIGLALLLTAGMLPWSPANANVGANPWVTPDPDGTTRVQLYFFWSTQCPHCRHALPFVSELGKRHSWLDVHTLEVNADHGHVKLYRELAASLGLQANSVPAFLFCGAMTTGFDSASTTGTALEASLHSCHQRVQENGPDGWQAFAREMRAETGQLQLPGNIDLNSLSLPVITLLLAGLDSFNPCAFFVLLFLLSLLVHAESRTRMLLIGGLFVSVSGLVYFLFMATWLNLFMVIGDLAWVTATAGGMAVIIALINIKDFFWLHRGVNLSIPDRARPRLYQRMRDLLYTGRLPALLFGTVMLALVANSYELLCTAGFPMVFTRILTQHELAPSSYYGYLLLYNIIYIIPLLFIVVVFSLTLGTRKLSERGGRLLKLLAGLMMLGLGLVLILAPASLNSATVAVMLLCAALLLTWLASRLVPG